MAWVPVLKHKFYKQMPLSQARGEITLAIPFWTYVLQKITELNYAGTIITAGNH